MEDDALEAAGQFGALVERVRQRRIENNTWSMVLREAYYSTRAGQPQAALDCGQLFLTQRSRTPQEIQYCRQELRAMMAYAMGNPVPSELLWQKYEDDQAGRFAAAVSAGRASAAEDDAVAARALRMAVALLSKDEPDYRVLAKWLQGPEAQSPKPACEAGWPVAFNRIAWPLWRCATRVDLVPLQMAHDALAQRITAIAADAEKAMAAAEAMKKIWETAAASNTRPVMPK